MRFERVEVWSRDEYQGGQEPRGFHWGGERYEVVEVLDRWYEGYVDSRRMPLRYFRVRTSDGGVFILRYHQLFQAWSLLNPEDAPMS